MSVASAAMSVRSRQAQNQRVMTVKQEEKSQREEDIVISVPESIKDFVSVIQNSLQSLLKKGSSASTDVEGKTDQDCKGKEATINTANTGCTVGKRIASTPIDIPMRDRNGNKYPVYKRKK